MNQLLEDQLEPCARAIAHFLVATGAPIGSAWKGYHHSEDLISFKRREDDLLEFVRSHNHEARLHLLKITEREPNLESIKVHEPIVLKSIPRATSNIRIENRDSDRSSEPYIWNKEFATGESEANAIEASVVSETWGEAKASGSIGVAEAEASTGFRNTLTAAWSRQTGRTRAQRTGGSFSLVAGPGDIVEGFLQWNEQTLQRRIEMDAVTDFAVEIGRRRKRKGDWKWTSGSPRYWDSLEHLIAVAERRGSVHHALYEHYAHNNIPKTSLIKQIQDKRLRHVDMLTPPYQGADGIRVVISKVT